MAENETIQTTEQAQQPEAPSLALTDLVFVAQLIQTVSQRGAIRAEEMTSVGALYNKLIAFLTSVGAIGPAPTETPANQETTND